MPGQSRRVPASPNPLQNGPRRIGSSPSTRPLGMNPAWGSKINCKIVVVDFVISKSLSNSGIFPHQDVLENVSRVETQYTARRTCSCITGRHGYQFTNKNGVSGPSHLPLHLLRPHHALEERQREMTLAGREVILFAVQIKDSLPFPG